MPKPPANPLLTPEVEGALCRLSKNALVDCLVDLLALQSGSCDEPPDLKQVADLLNARLRERGDRPISAPKAQAMRFEGLETMTPEWTSDPLREDRYPVGRSWEPCFLCERPVVNDRPHVRVETLGGSEVIAQDTRPANIEEHPNYTGTYAVGPVCAKRLEKRWKRRSK